MSKIPVPPEAREVSYEAFARPVSETAASATNRLFKKSGAIPYRVVVGQSGGGMNATIVTAESGDEAAEMALRKFPGWKVVNVAPPTDEFRSVDDFAGQEG